MSRTTDRAYGNKALWLWWHGLRDRLRGDHGRANARQGYLRPPAGEGRLVWLQAGGDVGSIRLAAGALRAVRQTRRDLRLVLSFEREYPQLLGRMLSDPDRTAFGHGPGDSPRAVRRTLRSLAPLGVLMVARQPAFNLSMALEAAAVRCLALHTPAAVAGRFQAAYPADRDQAEAWQRCGRADYIAPQVDLRTLLVEAQVDPNLRGALCGGTDLSVWCVLGANPRRLSELDTWWTDSGFGSRGVLIVALACPGKAPDSWLPISTWRRTSLAGGSVVLLDEDRWLPAVAAASDAIHVMDIDAWTFWQVLASGCPVSVLDRATVLRRFDADTAAGVADHVFEEAPTLADLSEFWIAMRADPISGRLRGDGLRRLFWSERRRAADINRELLQRVFEW
ncbi:MAG: hypothetical protein ACYDHM_03355 [Acidiferrobacterales bacterium]